MSRTPSLKPRTARPELGVNFGPHRPLSSLPGALLLAVMLGGPGCAAQEPAATNPERTGGSQGSGRAGGSGGSGSGGSGGASTGSGGAQSGSGGAPGSGGSAPPSADAATGSGGASAADAATTEASPGGTGGVPADAGGNAPADAPAGGTKPPGMGAPCASGGGYNFTIRPFTPAQKGTFTAYFTASPGKPRTNSVIGLSDGPKYLHDLYSVIIRFAENGNLDARNGTGYSSLSPIVYKDTEYHFRLVIDVAKRTYDAYVTFDGQPEVTIGTALAFRDTAATPGQLSHWGVEAIGGHTTKVCGFQVQ